MPVRSLLCLAALAATGFPAALHARATRADGTAITFPCKRPRAVDGDTVRCAGARMPLRLIGIDAPELPGHCRAGRVCVPGNPFAARAALQAQLRPPVTARPFGTDRYARPLVALYSHGSLINCTMIRTGHAQYVARWDHQKTLARSCAQ